MLHLAVKPNFIYSHAYLVPNLVLVKIVILGNTELRYVI
jgi:hypothetical protein